MTPGKGTGMNMKDDRLFPDSPDVGTPECRCSRCGTVIAEEDAPPIRVFVDEGRGGEYRYHPRCVAEGDE